MARAARFLPPGDRLLTEVQIDRYIRVRRAAKGRSDQEVARAVGVDPEEFAWARARVVEAMIVLDAQRVRVASDETYARTIASLKETRKSVKDPQTLRTLDEQIAALEREKASLRQLDSSPPNIVANARRVMARRAEIETLSR